MDAKHTPGRAVSHQQVLAQLVAAERWAINVQQAAATVGAQAVWDELIFTSGEQFEEFRRIVAAGQVEPK